MTLIEIFKIIIAATSGLALFLFGMDTMSDSLTQMTGGVLVKMTDFISKNKFTAFLFGAGITAIVQSSSAVSVLTVGLVNAGIIELEKAIGILIGANLGTTFTSWMLSLNAVDGQSIFMFLIKPSSFSAFLALIGVMGYMFSKSQKVKISSMALLGFSVMMIGMSTMSTGVSPLRDIPELKSMLVTFSDPVWGFCFALVFTMIIQSSDASIGIVQAFALSVGITFSSAIPLICGAHVGTCVTAMISSLGAGNNGKRTAFINLYYNLLKTIPLLVVFYILNTFFHFAFMEENVGAIGIPLMHTTINLIGSMIWLPFANVIVNLAKKTIPLSKEEEDEKANTLVMLEPSLKATPTYALDVTEKAIILLAETIRDAYDTMIHADNLEESEKSIIILCKRAEMYTNQIAFYLTDLNSGNFLDEDAAKHTLLVNTNTALGKIGSIIYSIMNEVKQEFESNLIEINDLNVQTQVFGEAIQEIIDITILGFEVKEPAIYRTIQFYREEITRLHTMMLMNYIEGVHNENYNTKHRELISGLFYSEERLIDSCDIISDALNKYAKTIGIKQNDSTIDIDQKRKQIQALFEDKKEMLRQNYDIK